MELVFITKAIRRYWWALAIGVLFGLLAGMVASPNQGDAYESEALILVAPISEFGSASTSTDRYVQNQLTLLSSVTLAQQVADDIGLGSAAAVRSAIIIEQVAGTDIIRLNVMASNPELSRDIANGYVAAYQDAVRRQSAEAMEPEVESIRNALEAIELQLQEIDARIQERLAPYLPGGVAANPQVIPSIDEIDPALSTERSVLLEEYTQLLTSRNQMELGTSQQRTGTQVLQHAELPTSPTTKGLPLLLLAGPVLGAIVGGFAAVALARVSRRVLDIDEIADVLGVPVTSSLTRQHSIAELGSLIEIGPPDELAAAVHQLCVQAEAGARHQDSALVVVVASTTRGAGATTTATLVARRYAENGVKVLLLDADAGDPELSGALGGAAKGIRALLEADRPAETRRGAVARTIRPYSETGFPNLKFAGLDETADGRTLRRQDVPTLLSSAGQHAQVLVIDVGPLMSAAASLHLAELGDALLLVVPEKQQDRAALEVIGRQLATVEATILPVVTDIPRARFWRRRGRDTSPHRSGQNAASGHGTKAISLDESSV